MTSVRQRKDAEAAWKLFHKRTAVDWAKPVKLKKPFPTAWDLVGRCVTTYYASDKWQKDRTFFERYYHDHDKETQVWVPSQGGKGESGPPAKIAKPPSAVVMLGYALGFDTKRGKEKGKLQPRSGALLVCAPDKRRLYVLEDGEVAAMVWGPKLRVEARGIVG